MKSENCCNCHAAIGYALVLSNAPLSSTDAHHFQHAESYLELGMLGDTR